MIFLQGATSGTTRSAWLRADGRFEFPVANEFDRTMTIRSVTIEITDRTRAGKKTVELDPAPDRDLDLGDVEMPAARKLRFEARDPSGTPIAGALARIGDADVDPGTRTDAQGIGSGSRSPGCEDRLGGRAQARGPGGAGPRPSAGVVADRAPAGGWPRDRGPLEGRHARLVGPRAHRVQGPGRVVDRERISATRISVAAGATEASFGTRRSTTAESNFPSAPGGRVVVSGLHSGIPLTVARSGRAGPRARECFRDVGDRGMEDDRAPFDGGAACAEGASS